MNDLVAWCLIALVVAVTAALVTLTVVTHLYYRAKDRARPIIYTPAWFEEFEDNNA